MVRRLSRFARSILKGMNQPRLKEENPYEPIQRIYATGGFLQAGTEHLLLALCRQEDSGALRLLCRLSVDVPALTTALRETIRLEQCEQNGDRQPPRVVGRPQKQTRSVMLDRFGRDLTEQARQGRLDPVIGRE